MSDIPGQSGSPAVLPGVFSQLPGSCLIGVSHFPYSGPEVLRPGFPRSTWPLLIFSLGCDVRCEYVVPLSRRWCYARWAQGAFPGVQTPQAKNGLRRTILRIKVGSRATAQ